MAQQLPHRKELQKEFGNIQFCGASFGTERMQAAINVHLSVNSAQTYSSSYYTDAYCHPDRSRILSGVAKVMPAAFQSIQRRLSAVQDVVYYGSELGPDIIKQAVGLTQGQATSGQLYSMGIQPLNKELSILAHLHPHAVLAAYIDDVKTQTSAALIERIIDTQIRDGQAFGALLKMEKHWILLEEVCATEGAALALQSRFHSRFHILLDRILIHPDNIADQASKAEGQLLYGDVVLGIPASPFSEFITVFVEGEVSRISSEWRLAAERLPSPLVLVEALSWI